MASVVSERYALSLYEVAQQEKQDKLYFEQLTAVAKVFADEPDFLKVLTTPSIELAEKQTILKNVFEGRIEPYLLNFLYLITEKGRVGLIGDMQQAYQDYYYLDQGIAEVSVTTAIPLSDELAEKLRAKMSQVTGKRVVLKSHVNPAMLGGVLVKINNEQFDTSLRTKLNEIASRLAKTIA